MARMFVLLTLVVLIGCSKQSAPATRPPVNPQITPDLLRSYFCLPGAERFTSAQRDRIWEEQLKGQRVRWTGTVEDVGTIDWHEGRVVNLRCDQTNVRVKIESDQALRLRARQRVTVEGTLEYHSEGSWGSYDLEDGQLW